MKGRPTESVIVGKTTPKGDAYVQVVGKPQLYLLGSWQLQSLDKSAADLAAGPAKN